MRLSIIAHQHILRRKEHIMKKVLLWVIGIILALGLIGSCSGDTDSALDDNSTLPHTQTEATTETTEGTTTTEAPTETTILETEPMETQAPVVTEPQSTTPPATQAPAPVVTQPPATEPPAPAETEPPKVVPQETTAQEKVEQYVWIPQSGSKYHSRKNCSNMKNPTQITLEQAKNRGYTACSKCH